MSRLRSLFPRLLAASLAIAVVTNCSPQAKKSRLLERAERYFKSGEYDKAKIEYLNLLRVDPQNATAFQQLGVIWFEQGAPLRAAPFLFKARELIPTNLNNRIKLAYVFTAVGEVGKARKEAIAILQQFPTNDQALLLLADTDRSKEDIDYTEQQLQKSHERNNIFFHLASANLAFQKKDMASAESAVRRALALDPKSSLAHLAMASFYTLQKNATQAGQEFKVAAELAPARSTERLKYAEFKALTGSVDEAKVLLTQITRQAPDYLPAWRVLAQIAFAGKNYDESLTLLENVFNRDTENIDARMLEAQVWLAKSEPKKAVEGLERLDKTYPKVPAIKYQLARAYLQSNNLAQASDSLRQALVGNPGYVEAILLLAELNLRTGNAQLVVAPLVDLLKKRPGLLPAQVLLAEAYRSLGRLDDAAEVAREQIRISPKSSQTYILLGMILRQQNKTDEARQAFEKALELTPESLLATNQLIELDISNKDFDTAMHRAELLLQKTPKSAGAHFLEAKIYATQRKWDRAEAALQTTLDLDPNFSNAYDLLISTYIGANKLPQAIGQLETLLVKSPKNTRALMMLALIYNQMKDFGKARDTYEKLLSISPDFVPALNNLAYLYTEHLSQLDKAYELARKARDLQPADAAIADTLGWIVYRRADYQQALTLLQESAAKLPNNPEVQFHLGMANYMMGQTEAARTAFERAANAPEDFPGKEESHRRLALMGNGSGTSRELSIHELEVSLQEQPNDLMALMRLGESYEKQGMTAKAAAAYEKVIQVSPKLLSIALKLAQLNAGPLRDKAKALEFAKKARELAPSDPKAAGILGRVAYQAGNFLWAYSLLQESARRLSEDTAILHDYAWAAYSLGKVSEAQQIMQRVLSAAPGPQESQDAKSFLAMTVLDQNAQDLSGAELEVQKLLKADAHYVPALMVQAAIQMQRGETKVAAETYAEILRRFPDFAPAQKHLASLYMEDPARSAESYELAVKARKILRDDPELAQILGEISYQRKEYAYALQLLQASATKRPLGAKALYYLGMSYLQTKEKSRAREVLNRALAQGLQEPLSADAKRAIVQLQRD